MEWTAGDVAEQALKEILVESGDATPEADEYADFLDAMNNYMAALEADNVILGYTEVDNVSDTVTVPSGAIRGIIANLAIEVAPQYGGRVTPALVSKASTCLDQIYRIGQQFGQQSYPTTLPHGAGTRLTEGDFVSPYYRPNVATVLTLSGNTSATDIVTAGTNVKVNGVWDVIGFEGFRGDITGRITNSLDSKETVTFKAKLTLKAAASITGAVIAFYRNGVSVNSTTANLTTSTTTVTHSASIELQPGDYVEIYVGDPTTTSDITVTDARWETL